MISVGNRAVTYVLQLLTAPPGVNGSIASIAESEGIALAPIPTSQILAGNVSFEIAERSGDRKYTALYVYCDKLSNELKEKFRTFSGKALVVVEVRASQDRLERIDEALELYADAVMQMLDQNRGDWGGGLFYAGGYEAVFGTVKHGGRNFIKTAKISFTVEASIN